MRRYYLIKRRIFQAATAAVLLFFLSCRAFAAVQTEKMVWDIWKKLESNPDDLAAVVSECEEFKNGRQTDALAPVVEGFLAWCCFKTGKMPDGAKIFMALEKKRYSDVQKAASEMARTWLTRIDIKLVELALQMYYRQNVAYPEKLSTALQMYGKATRASKTDRWDRPWEYELVGFKHLIKVPKDQKYDLHSSMLGEDSNFEKALEIPYASRIKLVPMKMGITTRGQESVYFTLDGSNAATPILLEVGKRKYGATLAYVGDNILVLTDGNHWKLLPRPRR